MTAALVAEGVRKSYGDVTALEGVSLEVATGEVFGLVGPNGAGKTTLVRALTGTTRAEGRVRVLGADPTGVERSRIGLLPQSFSPAGRLTPRELLAQYAGRYDAARDPEAVLSDVGIDGEPTEQWYETLSGGQKRRVCVAIALVNDPEVLFLDEPTTGIDPAGRRALWELLEDLAAGGTTVLLTSHSMAEVERLSDRVGFLNRGRLVAVGTPKDLIAAHGGRSRLVVDTGGSAPASEPEFGALGDDFEVSSRAGQVVVEGVGPRDIDGAVAAFDADGIAIESLTWAQPDLGDVYLELTGESLAGDDVGPDGGGGDAGRAAR
ncbi:ABC transporter ATP-binding protein [Halobellus salinus]|uniref:ABC transporter ATP-binding protein n=1 Tax=Halobellus salinus TaxID=931585 RepID=A0A830EE88_9EURY|nr:ABC transporter ATP-binding protein [Halobellus salinus]GGJ15912.1 ABC transporter ATP-binding protein [Halobellus salinus]SMP30187.1 ABC-2 type transport system ATP-binding protein [Halobellus salinus]